MLKQKKVRLCSPGLREIDKKTCISLCLFISINSHFHWVTNEVKAQIKLRNYLIKKGILYLQKINPNWQAQLNLKYQKRFEIWGFFISLFHISVRFILTSLKTRLWFLSNNLLSNLFSSKIWAICSRMQREIDMPKMKMKNEY